MKAEEGRQAEKAEARSKGLDRIFRFGLKQDENAEVIILDDSLADATFFHEHSDFNQATKKYVFEVCPKEIYDCPVCQATGRDSTFTLFLSILHIDAYKDKNTNELRHSRNLLPIKYSQLAEFKKVLKMAETKHGTLRGVVLNLHRPTGPVTQSPRIGVPTEIEGMDTRFDFIEDLKDEFGHDKIMGQDGSTVVKEQDLDITAFDWNSLFPMASDLEACVTDLRTRYADGKAPAGSDAETAAWTDDSQPAAAKRTRSRRAAEPEAETATSPSRSRGRRTAEAEVPDTETRSRSRSKGDGWAE